MSGIMVNKDMCKVVMTIYKEENSLNIYNTPQTLVLSVLSRLDVITHRKTYSHPALDSGLQYFVANAFNFALTPPQWGRLGGGQPTQQDKNGGVAC